MFARYLDLIVSEMFYCPAYDAVSLKLDTADAVGYFFLVINGNSYYGNDKS